ncbi:hypothetical protein HKX48_006033 [Thoreauomyces humboldtii]|nr:hypothetical protein HKX48_006033 [Thoreauomyces humboldtii]
MASTAAAGKFTREELLQQWKQTRAPASKGLRSNALQRSNPNLEKVKTGTSELKGGRRPGIKVAKAKDSQENEKKSGRVARRPKDGPQKTEGETVPDEEFNPTLLESSNVRGVLDAIDDNFVAPDSKVSGANLRSSAKPRPATGPIAQLQQALSARNEDVKALENRLSEEAARVQRWQIDAETRKAEMDQVREDVQSLQEALSAAERELMDRDDTLEENRRMLAQAGRERRMDQERILALEAQVHALLSAAPPRQEEHVNDAVQNTEELLASLEDTQRQNLQLEMKLAEMDALLKTTENSYEQLLEAGQLRATKSEDRCHTLEMELGDVSAVRREVESVWEYVLTVTDRAVRPSDVPLLVGVQRMVDQGNQTISRIRDEKMSLQSELDEVCTVLETMEKRADEAEQASEEYLPTLARAEELQTQMMAKEVELWRVREELDTVNATLVETQEALREALDENEEMSLQLHVSMAGACKEDGTPRPGGGPGQDIGSNEIQIEPMVSSFAEHTK